MRINLIGTSYENAVYQASGPAQASWAFAKPPGPSLLLTASI